MTEIKTPYDFSLGGKDKYYAVKASKCSNDVEELIYWFNEYLSICLDSIVEREDAMREQEWKFTAHSIPTNLLPLLACTWLKFDYFCHTKENDDNLPEGIYSSEISSVKPDLVSTHTDLEESDYTYKSSYFKKLLSYVKKSNYLATCFAEAGWDLRTETPIGCDMRYVLSWRTPDAAKDRVKKLPKKVDDYTKSTIVAVNDSKVKNKLEFDSEKLINWFNTELENFYSGLTEIETLKYAVSKEFWVDYHDIPTYYYKTVAGKPYTSSKYIVFTKPFIDTLEENHWYIDSHSEDISGQFSEPDLIKFVYKGTE